jgi:uncharacterized protein (DUF924 family)
VSSINQVIDFWFLPGDGPGFEKSKGNWFAKDDRFYRRIIETFSEAYEQAVAGKLDPWKGSAEGCLALLLLLDQFSRNMFRGDRKSFAADAQARVIADHAVAQGFDKTFGPHQRFFFYLPFEHSEDLDDQKRCLTLVREIPGAMEPEGYYKWAHAHYVIIERFGRFPHRNAVLGRESTAEELEFLTQEGSSF